MNIPVRDAQFLEDLRSRRCLGPSFTSLSKRQLRDMNGSFAFSPLRDSDVQPTYPCVDFADKHSGVLTGGWCWEQLQVQVRYSVVE
jgi:hypothetical protein